jgi:transcriptional regulator with XRE-family HTH domain
MTYSGALAMIAAVATRIRKSVRPYLYLDEWIEHRGLNNETIANRLGRDHSTIWRWRKEKRRLTPEKQAELASALDIAPEELWRPPQRISLDAILKDATDDVRARAADIVRVLIKTGT